MAMPARRGQDVGEVVAGAVGHGDALERGVGRHLGAQVGQRPGAGPLLGLLGHLAVLELDHRLDVEQRAEQGAGPADAAAALEVLEPADHAVDAGAGDAVLGGGHQLVEAGAGGGLLGRGDDEQALAHGEREGVDDAHGHAGEGVGRRDGRGVGRPTPSTRWSGTARRRRPRRPPAGRRPGTQPGEGAAVSGRAPLPRQRSQNSAGVSWRRSSSSSSPKRMVSGTTMTLCSLTSWSVRSQALSVTMWTPGMHGVCHGGAGAEQAPRRFRGRAASGGAPAGAGGRPGRGRAGGAVRRRVVAPAQPDHHGAEGEPAGDDGADDPGEQPGDAGRPREVRHHQDDDAHRDEATTTRQSGAQVSRSARRPNHWWKTARASRAATV